MEGQFLLDGDCATGEFAASLLTTDIAGYLNLSKTVVCWPVVIEDIKRIFTGMKTGTANFYRAVVMVGFPDLELIITASQVGLKPL